jgi:hypothetical protein
MFETITRQRLQAFKRIFSSSSSELVNRDRHRSFATSVSLYNRLPQTIPTVFALQPIASPSTKRVYVTTNVAHA